jgi:hypothetical protein
LPHGETVFTFSVAELLGNDLRGPANESGQSLEVISVQSTGETVGQVTFNALAGTITYTVPANFDHLDTFTYTIRDNGTTAGSADPKESTGTVEIIDYIPSTLSGGYMLGSTGGLGGVSIEITIESDVFGTMTLPPVKTKANGAFEFSELPPGTVTISSPQPIFLQQGTDVEGSQGAEIEVTATGETIMHIELAEDTTGLGNLFSEAGRKPEYYSVRDFLNTTPRRSVMFATHTTNGQHWFAFREGWEDIVDAEFKLSPDRSTISIKAFHSNGQIYTTSVPTAGNYRVEFLGQIGESFLIRLAGGFSDYDFQPVDQESESLAATEPTDTAENEMEGEYIAPSIVVSNQTTPTDSPHNVGEQSSAYDVASDDGALADQAMADYDYFSL